ncbi:hypothetical protein [Altererythrobacter lutimaris]|uniref:Tetratricopeptide repeat protein n=1 Tax=Altererythrobacter lutimaris TaxID=2743979 RepID=A0A850H6W8_9SPHN|nr:hypothetical protein [Altererythrobacter lutimaris]NVE95004.1 hypothetical protein [Altererythrobacter lutimaris]
MKHARAFLLAAISAALFSISTPTLAATPAPTACDMAAAHPADPDRVTTGLAREAIDLEAAVAACQQVLAERPDHARSAYQLGRVLFYQGKAAEAVPYLLQAEQVGYRQAIFVLGFIDITGASPVSDACKGLARIRRGVALDHPWSGYYLVSASLDGTFQPCKDAPERAELERAMQLAQQTITVEASRGQVEALAAKFEDAGAAQTQ